MAEAPEIVLDGRNYMFVVVSIAALLELGALLWCVCVPAWMAWNRDRRSEMCVPPPRGREVQALTGIAQYPCKPLPWQLHPTVLSMACPPTHAGWVHGPCCYWVVMTGFRIDKTTTPLRPR